MSSTRLGKIDSVWHTTPNYQACNEAEKMKRNEAGKKSMDEGWTRNETDDRICENKKGGALKELL